MKQTIENVQSRISALLAKMKNEPSKNTAYYLKHPNEKKSKHYVQYHRLYKKLMRANKTLCSLKQNKQKKQWGVDKASKYTKVQKRSFALSRTLVHQTMRITVISQQNHYQALSAVAGFEVNKVPMFTQNVKKWLFDKICKQYKCKQIMPTYDFYVNQHRNSLLSKPVECVTIDDEEPTTPVAKQTTPVAEQTTPTLKRKWCQQYAQESKQPLRLQTARKRTTQRKVKKVKFSSTVIVKRYVPCVSDYVTESDSDDSQDGDAIGEMKLGHKLRNPFDDSDDDSEFPLLAEIKSGQIFGSKYDSLMLESCNDSLADSFDDNASDVIVAELYGEGCWNESSDDMLMYYD
jgi:hypothetical protein